MGRNLPAETRDIHIVSSGSRNVRGSIPTGYIEKIVIDCSRILAFGRGTSFGAVLEAKEKGKLKEIETGKAMARSHLAPTTTRAMATANGATTVVSPMMGQKGESVNTRPWL